MSKKKVILSTIAILIVMFAAVSVVSYSIANLGHGDKVSEDVVQSEITTLGADGTATNYTTNIDLIIQNSNTNGDTFNIVEILPDGVASSGLDQYSSVTKDDGTGNTVTTSDFATYVLDAYKSASNTQNMRQDKVKYNLLSVNSNTDLASEYSDGVTVQNLLDSADLIYFSSPNYDSYDGVMNISDDMYNYFQNYAIAHGKPIIVDFVTASSGAGDKATTYKQLAQSMEFSYIKYRTFAWNDGVSADDFFRSRSSYYLRKDANTLKQRANGKVLVLTTNAESTTKGSDTISDKMNGYADMISVAYYGAQDMLPEAMEYVYQDVDSDALTVEDLNTEYDFIVIENSVAGQSLSADVYNRLKALSETSNYIIFDGRMVGDSDEPVIEIAKNNYLKLLYNLVNGTGIENYTNVLAVSSNFFANLKSAGANAPADTKKVADLINNAIYRDTATSGAAGRKFRVLEIQPCYPIDLEIAESNPTDTTGGYSKWSGRTGVKGSYYTLPDQMLYGYSKEEVPEGKEYYAFEVTKAKIANALDMPYNQIEIDHMSTNQFIATKKVVRESYDLVYIGGDTSALASHEMINYGGDSGYTYQNDQHSKALAAFTAFDMYTHTGNYIDYSLTYDKVGTDTNSVATNGNDLTTIKRDELIDYVDAKLPIIIDSVVAEAFEESYALDSKNPDAKSPNRLSQLALTDIDPDSNMYQLLTHIYKNKDDYKSVCWGEFNTKTDVMQIDNTDRSLGNTMGPNVTVYDEDAKDCVSALRRDSNKRPSLTVSKFPKNYVEGNASTTNMSVEKANGEIEYAASFTATVSSQDNSTTAKQYLVELYVDANGDGMYLESERVAYQECADGGTVSLTYTLEPSFFGLINWQIKATEVGTTMCDTITGNALFKYNDDAKKLIRVLQVMPFEGDVTTEQISAGDPYIGKHSLYFCTECQQATKIIKNNITVDSVSDSHEVTKAPDPGVHSYNDTATISYGTNREVNVGLHQHVFGIVPYDSSTRVDDYSSNIADALTHGPSGTLEDGDFEFIIDIVTDDDFDDICSRAVGRTDTEMETALENALAYKASYESKLEKIDTWTISVPNNLDTTNEYGTIEELTYVLNQELYKAAAELKAVGTKRDNAASYADTIVEGIGDANNPGLWIQEKTYYKFFEFYAPGTLGATGDANLVSNIDLLIYCYNEYSEKYDDIVEDWNSYRTNIQQVGDADTWMEENYEIVVLGLADGFNYEDLDPESVQQLKTYIDNDGAVLNTHDTLTGESNKGAVTLTRGLRETFGMDRFHVTGVKTPDAEATVSVPITNNMKGNYTVNLYQDEVTTQSLMIYQKGAEHAAYTFDVSNSDLSVPLVKSQYENTINTGQSGKPVAGTKHASVKDEVKVTVTYKDYQGNPVSGVTLVLDDKQWDNVSLDEVVTGADGTATFTISQKYNTTEYACILGDVYKSDIEADITLGTAPTATLTKTTEGTPKATGENLTMTFHVKDAQGNVVPNGVRVSMDGAQDATTVDGTVNMTFTPTVKDMGAGISLSSKNVIYDMSVTGEQVTVTSVSSSASAEATISVTFNVTGIADGQTLTLNYGGTNYTAVVTDGKAIFTGVAKTQVAAGQKYRVYDTKDNTKYFWTERLKVSYADAINDQVVKGYIHYNAPLGLTDMYAIYNGMDAPLGPYKYVMFHPEAFDHASDGNGITWEAKYGTRKAEQVNKGGVTFFPFVIAEEMFISPTHSQVFALDLEDPTVAVWYSMGSNYVDSSTPVPVTKEFARYSSIIFAASPKDGMNNYFLYSKNNVFYTGAGHQRVTSRDKNNNDERRLFINVIVNSATKGILDPMLKLYNCCPGCNEDAHAKGECQYVNPNDKAGNDILAKQLNTLYYNAKEEVYQYNIDESQEVIYPEFDFKAIAGTSDIKSVKVFYDLNYDKDGTIDDPVMDQSDAYTADGNHVLIDSFTQADQVDGKRIELRQTKHDKLLLEDRYFEGYEGYYGDKYTYIVIHVIDRKGNDCSARIKINKIPHLFDLTDAGSESEYSSFDSILLDMSDRKFNI